MSPENLGTGLNLEATIKVPAKEAKPDERKSLEAKLHDAIFYSKSIKVTVVDETEADGTHAFKVCLKSVQTLAPNYNEMI